MREGTAAETSHIVTHGHGCRDVTLLLQTGTVVETSHMGIKVETSHIFYTQARRPRRHTLIYMGTAAKTSHTVTHGHSGRDITHCYTRARWPGRHTFYIQTQQARQHTLLHMDTAAETPHIVTHGHSGGDITHCYTRAERLKL